MFSPEIRQIKSYKTLDLFCGCGSGLSLGLYNSGLEIIAGIDIWDKAIESYKKNHSHIAICKDISELSPLQFKEAYYQGEIDVIVGGVPCQGYSTAGKRDKNDPRNSLFMEFVKYLDFFKPKIFLFENVMGILSMKNNKNEKCIDIIMNYLEKNYNCHINRLYASNFEVPQNRRRVIIIGIRKDLNIFPTDIPIVNRDEEKIPVSSILLEKEKVDKKYFLSQKAIQGILNKKKKMKEKSFGFGAQFLDLNKPSYTIPSRYWKDGYDALVKYSDTEIRRLTELELKRIQTFPDDYELCGTKKDVIIQIGNAIPMRFAFHLGNYIIDVLESLEILEK